MRKTYQFAKIPVSKVTIDIDNTELDAKLIYIYGCYNFEIQFFLTKKNIKTLCKFLIKILSNKTSNFTYSLKKYFDGHDLHFFGNTVYINSIPYILKALIEDELITKDDIKKMFKKYSDVYSIYTDTILSVMYLLR